MVDDAVEATDPLVRLLQLEGFAVQCTKSGSDGLRLAQSGAFAAMILDLHLPDIAGITILNEVRNTAIRLPVIVVTGRYIQTDHEQLALTLGAARFLLKPLDALELAATVRLAIESSNQPTVQVVPTKESERRGLRARLGPLPSVASDHLLHLHSSALTGDQSAIEQLVQRLLGPVIAHLRHRWPHVELEWLNDAAVDALLEYSSRPSRFEPSRGVPLSLYIQHAARKNLLNRIDAEARRSRRQVPLGVIDIPSRPLDEADPHTARLAQLAGAIDEFTEAEREVFRLWTEGERRVSEYARALAIDVSGTHDARVAIRRMKERVRQRLKRWILRTRHG
jgi:DNA-binding response OmpR family regulator